MVPAGSQKLLSAEMTKMTKNHFFINTGTSEEVSDLEDFLQHLEFHLLM